MNTVVRENAAEAALLGARAMFPTVTKSVHLISHSLGAMPAKAREFANQFLDEWENDSIAAWGKWVPAVRSLGDTVAQVLGVAQGSVVMLPNVSTVQAVVASCFSFPQPSGPWKGRDKIVYCDLNFSTVHYVWQEQARRGAKIQIVSSKDGIHAPIDELIDAIDETTLLVPISHVLFRSSAMYDIHRVVARAKAKGALVLLDCYQSAATVPLALAEWGVDMACGGSVKWACGGPGAAYLYVRPDLLPHLEPASTGWFAHEAPFAFDMGPMKYAPDVFRMVGGTMAIPAIYTARAGWETIHRLGVPAIRKKSLRQTTLVRELVRSRGFAVNTPEADDARGGTICFDFEGAEAVSRALVAEKFFHDYRPRCGLRVSPHFYTTDDDLHAFFEALDRIRANPTTASGGAARAY